MKDLRKGWETAKQCEPEKKGEMTHCIVAGEKALAQWRIVSNFMIKNKIPTVR